MPIMKRLFLILLFLCSCIQAADLRPWLLSDGRSFLATYTKSTDESVTLTAKNGKTATFKIIQLSIPDLLYLQENHSLNTKDLKIPALLNAEKLLQINSANFKKPGSQSFKGEEDTHRFTVVVTPHFIIMHPNKMKPDHLIDTLERVWFSIAYRHPGLPEFWGIKRRVYLLFDNKDVYDDLRTYAYEANLEQEMPPRQANQIQQVTPSSSSLMKTAKSSKALITSSPKKATAKFTTNSTLHLTGRTKTTPPDTTAGPSLTPSTTNSPAH